MSAPAEQASEFHGILTRAHQEAEALLGGRGNPLDLVAWLSAHLAAFDHIIYPAVRKHLPHAGELVAADRQVASRLARALRIAERRHSGDVLAAGLSADRLSDRIAELMHTQQVTQGPILDQLAEALDHSQLADLTERYSAALSHAPTRPHPHLSRGGLMFRLDALRDRILDTMDGRHVPVPRLPRRTIMPGRWGHYLLGHPDDTDRETG